MGGLRWLPRWPIAVFLVSAAVLTLCGDGVRQVVSGALAVVGCLLGIVVTARVAFRRDRPARERKPWLFLLGYWVLQLLMSVMFGAAFSAGPDMPPNPGFLLAGVLLWALAGVPTLLCLLSFPVRPMTRPERVRFGLDLATVCGGGFIALWFLVLAPALAGRINATQMITVVQPLEHLVILFAVCAVMMRGAVSSLRHPLTFLLAGQATLAVAVIFVAYHLVHGELPGILPRDLLMQGGTYLLVMSAVMQARGVGRDERRSVTGSGVRPTVIPYLALGLGYVILVAAALGSGTLSWIGLVASAVIMTAAVAGRQFIALRENHRFLMRDPLTGLSSRVALYDDLDRAVERSTRTGRPAAVLLIDLNGFKPINDRFGHAAGDELLAGFGAVLRACVRSGDTAARLGGDEFAVILPDVTDVVSALRVADSIVAECATPFTAAGEQVTVGASIGVSITDPAQPCAAQELLRRADVAMYTIKHQRGPRHVLPYDVSMDLDPQSVPESTTMPGLDAGELAELDRLHSRVRDLERKGATHTANR